MTGSPNVELVRSIYADWERGDSSRSDWADPEIELVIADGPDPGGWTGRAAMRDAVGDLLAAWEVVRLMPEQYRELGGERLPVLSRDSACFKTSGLEAAQDGLTAIIDTSILVGSDAPALDEPWVVSVVTVGELEAGVLLAPTEHMRARRLGKLAAVLEEAPVVPIDQVVALRYGELRATAGRRPTNDLWIAATALAHDLTLVTADEQLASLSFIRVTLV